MSVLNGNAKRNKWKIHLWNENNVYYKCDNTFLIYKFTTIIKIKQLKLDLCFVLADSVSVNKGIYSPLTCIADDGNN